MSGLTVSDLFYKIRDAKDRIIVNQGGTRSGKTYSILQSLIVEALEGQTKQIYSVVRKTFPALKATALRDFIEILETLDVYDENNHNKSDQIYLLNGCEFEFFSLDQPQKVRGRKRNVLFINEANELTLEDWRQLSIRTTGQIYIDYNPSDEYHWIYDEVLPRQDCTFIKSTYKDNPFLEKAIVDEIEGLQFIDENFWRIYGLGEKGVSMENIYTHYKEVDSLPDGGDYCYGLDFGYNHPTALSKVTIKDGAAYVDEIIYESKLTTNDLIRKLNILIPDKRKEIFADAAEPKTIEEISRAGFNIKPAEKDVALGIGKVKSTPLNIIKTSVNALREIRNYKWKVDKNGKTLDEPVKFNDDFMDSMRYAIYNFVKSNIRTYKPRSYAAQSRTW